MNQSYDVIIIGSGPAGIFAALELVKHSDLRILMIEKGSDITTWMMVALIIIVLLALGAVIFYFFVGPRMRAKERPEGKAGAASAGAKRPAGAAGAKPPMQRKAGAGKPSGASPKKQPPAKATVEKKAGAAGKLKKAAGK